MRTATRLWEANEYDPGVLIRGLLTEAEHWYAERPDEIDESISGGGSTTAVPPMRGICGFLPRASPRDPTTRALLKAGSTA